MESGQVTDLLRAVFDTNVFVSALLARSLTSPSLELLDRCERGEFILLVCEEIIMELSEKLLELGRDEDLVTGFMTRIRQLTERVRVASSAIEPVIPADPDDDVVVACAVIGKADYLVSSDKHFDVLGELYQGIRITRPLPFLWAVRQSQAQGLDPLSVYPA